MTVKEWMEGEQGKHFCQCGCGREIIIIPYHYNHGVSKYIRGHNSKRTFNIDEWIKEEQGKHFCQCGCGKEIKITRHHHSRGIPKNIRGHQPTGEAHWKYGTTQTEEARRKIREGNRGKVVSDETRRKMREGNIGKHHVSEETRRKMRENHADFSGKNSPLYGKHPSEGTRQKMREKRHHRVFPTHHTKPELKFEEICKSNNLPFHYVGDGQLWIGKTKKLNPDFCELNGKKIVVEVFGRYFHSPLQNPKLREEATLAYRKNHYKKYGWESYFIWDTDLLRPDAEQFVLNLLKGVDVPK